MSLTSCVCKLFESLVKSRLQWWCEHHNFLPNSQAGFRKGQSCHDNLVNLLLHIEDGFASHRDTIAAFLDVEEAFDNVISEILLDKLASIGCSKKIISFIKFLTYVRRVTAQNTGNNVRLVSKGVPQGGVLSPLLYTMYVALIMENIPKNVQVSQFADDIAIYCKIAPLKRSKNAIEKAILMIKSNLRTLGLELCAHKTVLIHFNNTNQKPRETQIQIDGTVIKSSECTRFLGITFDYKLSFNQHITQLQKKCLKAINIIKF